MFVIKKRIYAHSVLFGENSSSSEMLFTLQNEVMKIMAGAKSRNLNRSNFKMLYSASSMWIPICLNELPY